MARKDSVTLGWGGARAHAHVCIQGTGAPDPAGGGGGQWGQTATPADPAVEQVGPWGIGKGLHRLAEAQPSALPAWPRPLDWVTNFTHIWASSSGHRKSVERSRLRPPLAAKAPHLSREWKA